MEAETENFGVIIRHGHPNQYDHAKQGTICKVIDFDGSYDIFKQTGPDESNPIWIRM